MTGQGSICNGNMLYCVLSLVKSYKHYIFILWYSHFILTDAYLQNWWECIFIYKNITRCPSHLKIEYIFHLKADPLTAPVALRILLEKELQHKPFLGPSGQNAMEWEGGNQPCERICVTAKWARLRLQEQKSSIRGMFPHHPCCAATPWAIFRTLQCFPKHFSLSIPSPRMWFPDPMLAVAFSCGQRLPQGTRNCSSGRVCLILSWSASCGWGACCSTVLWTESCLKNIIVWEPRG